MSPQRPAMPSEARKCEGACGTSSWEARKASGLRLPWNGNGIVSGGARRQRERRVGAQRARQVGDALELRRHGEEAAAQLRRDQRLRKLQPHAHDEGGRSSSSAELSDEPKSQKSRSRSHELPPSEAKACEFFQGTRGNGRPLATWFQSLSVSWPGNLACSTGLPNRGGAS